jgi:hypothetical protein
MHRVELKYILCMLHHNFLLHVFLLRLLDSSGYLVFIELLLHDMGCPVIEVSSF